MSGLYNMLMGRNPHGPYLMGALGFVRGAEQNAWLGRFRDVYTNDAADRIFILHRNYPETDEFNQAIKAHPNFLRYIPEPTDFSYGVWEFSVPDFATDVVKQIAALGDNTPLMDRYRKLITDMEKGVDNEATRNAMEAGKKILQPIIDSVKDGKSGEQHITHGDGSVVVINVVPEKEQPLNPNPEA
jgi:hypothetical protein